MTAMDSEDSFNDFLAASMEDDEDALCRVGNSRPSMPSGYGAPYGGRQPSYGRNMGDGGYPYGGGYGGHGSPYGSSVGGRGSLYGGASGDPLASINLDALPKGGPKRSMSASRLKEESTSRGSLGARPEVLSRASSIGGKPESLSRASSSKAKEEPAPRASTQSAKQTAQAQMTRTMSAPSDEEDLSLTQESQKDEAPAPSAFASYLSEMQELTASSQKLKEMQEENRLKQEREEEERKERARELEERMRREAEEEEIRKKEEEERERQRLKEEQDAEQRRKEEEERLQREEGERLKRDEEERVKREERERLKREEEERLKREEDERLKREEEERVRREEEASATREEEEEERAKHLEEERAKREEEEEEAERAKRAEEERLKREKEEAERVRREADQLQRETEERNKLLKHRQDEEDEQRKCEEERLLKERLQREEEEGRQREARERAQRDEEEEARQRKDEEAQQAEHQRRLVREDAVRHERLHEEAEVLKQKAEDEKRAQEEKEERAREEEFERIQLEREERLLQQEEEDRLRRANGKGSDDEQQEGYSADEFDSEHEDERPPESQASLEQEQVHRVPEELLRKQLQHAGLEAQQREDETGQTQQAENREGQPLIKIRPPALSGDLVEEEAFLANLRQSPTRSGQAEREPSAVRPTSLSEARHSHATKRSVEASQRQARASVTSLDDEPLVMVASQPRSERDMFGDLKHARQRNPEGKSRLEAELEMTERILRGCEKENEKLVAHNNQLREATRLKKEALDYKQLQLVAELNAARVSADTNPASMRRLVEVERELVVAKERANELGLELERAREAKRVLERELVNGPKPADGPDVTAQLEAVTAAARQAEQDVAELKEKLRWYAEGQQEMEEDRREVTRLREEVTALRKENAELRHRPTAKDSQRRIAELRAQVEELQECLRKKNPDSILALIKACEPRPEEKKEVRVLRQRVEELQAKLLERDETHDRQLRTLRARYDSLRQAYEKRSSTRTTQESGPAGRAASETARAGGPDREAVLMARIKDLERQVEHTKSYYLSKLRKKEPLVPTAQKVTRPKASSSTTAATNTSINWQDMVTGWQLSGDIPADQDLQRGTTHQWAESASTLHEAAPLQRNVDSDLPPTAPVQAWGLVQPAPPQVSLQPVLVAQQAVQALKAQVLDLETENASLRSQVQKLTVRCQETTALLAQSPAQVVRQLQSDIAELQSRLHEQQTGQATAARMTEITLRGELDVARHETSTLRAALDAKEQEVLRYQHELEEIISELMALKGHSRI